MQSQNTNLETSPTKRSTFRSKTKLKDNPSQLSSKPKSIISFKMYLKEFPLGMPEDVVKIVHTFQPIHENFQQNLENLKLYKSGLASLFEQNWAESMEILRGVISKMNKRAEKMMEEKEEKIVELLNLNSSLEKEKENIKQKLSNIEHLRQLENAQLNLAQNELDIVNREMNDIYKILQADMGKILKYLTSVEQTRKKESEEGAFKVYSSLDDFSLLLNNLEAEQKQAGNTLSTMRQLIKAMARNTKTTTGTQVDESQLRTQAANIFSKSDNKQIPFEALDGTALHTADEGNYEHTLDKLRLKQKSHDHENFHPKKNADKPWALTPTLLIFLENMSKENQSGRVLPWEFMKGVINEIYEERIKSEQEMTSAMVGNGMLFDEFVVFYFLKKYKIRRLAEVKLLEFIISLKYYSRFWTKAEIFCYLMDVMKYQPAFDHSDSSNYRFDYYAQNFFFQVYKKISKFDLIHEEDGTVYVSTRKVKKLMKIMLFFTDDISRSRSAVKLDKDLRIYEKVEHADFDFALLLFIDEYFASRKKISNTLGKAFQRLRDQVQGFMSIEELLTVFNELARIYNSADQFSQKYPVQSPLQVSKLYLYAITSGKNDYQITSSDFLQACQRYGFDAPFPFMHNCTKLKKSSDEEESSSKKQQDTSQSARIAQREERGNFPVMTTVEEGERGEVLLNQERIDATSKIFSQHFSLLKELKGYVDIFSSTLMNEKDIEVVWKSFNQIKIVLDKGCSFLKYPLISVKNVGQ